MSAMVFVAMINEPTDGWSIGGVYSSRKAALDAIEEAKADPINSDDAEDYRIEVYELDR